MDLVEAEVVAEQRSGFLELARECGGAEILDLMALGIEAPVTNVRVSPLRADRDVSGAEVPSCEPSGEKAFREPVGTGHIDVAHAGFIRGVENRLCATAHRLEPAGVPELDIASGCDVRGATERGEAEPDAWSVAQRLMCPGHDRGYAAPFVHIEGVNR